MNTNDIYNNIFLYNVKNDQYFLQNTIWGVQTVYHDARVRINKSDIMWKDMNM